MDEKNNVDVNRPPKRKLSKQQIVTLVVIGALLIFGISVAASMRQNDAAIEKNGIETTAVSTGQYLQTRDGGRRSATVYKAQYSFEVNGMTQFVYGEKKYGSVEEITEGKTVKVKYLKDEPSESIVVSGE